MAQVVIKDISSLTKIFDIRVSRALTMTQNQIYAAIQKSLSEYYHEPVFSGSSNPRQYDRLYKLLNSIVKTKITRAGDTFCCSVEVNDEYLGYKYPGGATGREVWEWANANTHGGTVEGNLKVWDNAISNLGGEQGIINIMRENLIRCGVPTL